MKKGFTLIELLVVIALIALLLIIVVPSTIKVLDGGISNTMKIQEKEVADAAKMYLEDYCKSPLSHDIVCPFTKTITDGIIYYSGEVSLQTLVDNNYIQSVSIRNKDCVGRVVFVDSDPTAYLKCEDIYTTEGY